MIQLLLFLFIAALMLFVVVPIIKIASALYSAYRKVRRAASSSFFGGNGEESDADDAGRGFFRGRRRKAKRPLRQKIFSTDEGEYVRFEEVEVDTAVEQERRRQYGKTTYRTEEQVSDAEWVDIK